VQQTVTLFDHLVCERESEPLRGVEVDHQLVFFRKLQRQVSRLLALENFCRRKARRGDIDRANPSSSLEPKDQALLCIGTLCQVAALGRQRTTSWWHGGFVTTRWIVMDWNRIEGNWKQFKGQAKEKWGRLTDDDLDVINGRQDQLEGKIQERYGLAKDQAKKDVEAWFNSLP
jgi:uncharacterized protein YjbJ (UPF0337 family)